MTIREHDQVVLTADIPGESFQQGDVGTVVTVQADSVRPVGDKEIAHVRRVA